MISTLIKQINITQSLTIMLGLIRLANDPSNEELGLLPRLRQQLEGNHIQHLYGLIEFSIQLTEVVQPK